MFVVGPALLAEHVPASEHGRVYLAIVPAGLVLMAVSAFLADRSGLLKWAVVAGAASVMGSALFLLLGDGGFVATVSAIGLTIAAVALAEPAHPAMLTRLANDEARGTAAGIYHMCQFAGSFVGGVVGGLLLSAPHKLGFALLIGSAVWIAFAVGLPRLAPSPRAKRPGR
jgi:predicted MFS family arabinose efflux permease